LWREAQVGEVAVVALWFGIEVRVDVATRVFVASEELVAFIYFFPGVSEARNDLGSGCVARYDLPNMIRPSVAQPLVPQPMPLASRFVLRGHARLDTIQVKVRDTPGMLRYSWSRNRKKYGIDKSVRAHRILRDRRNHNLR